MMQREDGFSDPGHGAAGPFRGTLVRVDAQGCVTHVDCTDRRMLTCSPDRALGRQINDVMRPAIVDAITRSLESMPREGSGARIEFSIDVEKNGVVEVWEVVVFRTQERALSIIVRDVEGFIEARLHEQTYVKRLRDLAQQLEQVAEEERRSIAVELHDRVSQPLVAARLRIEHAGRMRRERGGAAVDEDESRILGLIDDALRESRAVTSELAPAAYYELGLVPAIRALTEDIGRRYGMQCTFECALPPDLEIGDGMSAFTYRSARELLSNAGRHSNSSDVSLRLAYDDGYLRLTVRDHGCGFDVREGLRLDRRSAEGFGLFSIREQADRLGGDLTIQSAVGIGTCSVLQVPLFDSA